ncbi:ABC transporter ATP-binding protein [Conexibacter arvalis]|uniref:Spermidine/putrescine import ATP-binding protein PotA n=1 Tax=Conexibacter arvalis TaxID=912552 RepID=A0A840I913_9ACTN|nr:ABC transporter ATP-binding protein [Conexibacter arvalis]MBB4661399.1 spermidine/putrescine ABC transporter ATP-binding subunit [Conexibacter arvalis]
MRQPATADANRGAIGLEQVAKSFKGAVAVDVVDIDIRPGEFVTLLGESGCGKTTTLLLIAGFHAPTSGRVTLDGRDVTRLPPYERNLGMVFQNYALFPHMTVEENIAYPLKRRKLGRGEIAAKVARSLELVGLAGYGKRHPRELSGGQQQRVAVARATVFDPPALLMDEPLSALDRKLRQSLQDEIRQIHRQLGTTVVYVTHDQDEALAMSDRIALMRGGRIEQIGSPTDVYRRPRTLFAAAFLGDANLLRGRVVSSAGGTAVVELRSGTRVGALADPEIAAGREVTVVVRPEHLRPADASAPGGAAVRATVEDVTYLGRSICCTGSFESGDRCIVPIETSGATEFPRVGDTLHLSWEASLATLVADVDDHDGR